MSRMSFSMGLERFGYYHRQDFSALSPRLILISANAFGRPKHVQAESPTAPIWRLSPRGFDTR